MFENLCDYLYEKLEELDRQVKNNGGLSDAEIQCGDIMAHFAKNLSAYIAMEEAPGYSERGRSYDDGRGMRDMRRGNSYRDVDVRRYSRGYSRNDRMDDVVQSVNNAMNDMPEDMRREAQRFLNRMQQM